MLKNLRLYGIYLFLLLFYTALFISALFFLHITISRWTLVLSFTSYNLIIGIYSKLRQKSSYLQTIGLMAIATLIGFIALAGIFSKTYDVSYDGMYYHEPAIIALSEGWNPIYDKSLPITAEPSFSRQLIEASPKASWSIEASISKLTGNLDSATCLNLIVDLIALIFVYSAVRELGFDHTNSITLSLLAVLTEITMDQIFSFREDSISYGFFLVALSSMVMIIRNKSKEVYFACFSAALILLAATKFTNLFVVTPLLLVITYLMLKNHWYKNKTFRIGVVLGLLFALILTFNPYISNIIKYKAVDYPYNNALITKNSKDTGVPVNLRSDNKLELFFYGIFARTNDIDPGARGSNAKLKIPFSIYPNEIDSEADTAAKTVGGYGLIFSGLLIISLLAYVYLLCKIEAKNIVAIKWLSLTLLLILLACLISPIPNYARYNSELGLVPILIVLTLILFQKKRSEGINISGKIAKAIVFITALNAALGLILITSFYSLVFSDLNHQIGKLSSSGSTYSVFSPTFYSDYELLRQQGVRIEVSTKPLKCKNMKILDYSRNTTDICKLYQK
jgi:hypothetical protein